MREPIPHYFQVGTNDLASNKRPEKIAEATVGAATSLNSDIYDVLVSSITVINDQHRKKVAGVNIVLKSYVKKKAYIIQTMKRKSQLNT